MIKAATTKFQSKPFILFFLVVFCLAGLETQTALLQTRSFNPLFLPLVKGETSGLSFPCQGHGCGCNDVDDCRNHCCCFKTALSDVSVKAGISYFTKTLHCRGVHTNIPISHLTQYEPLALLKARFGDVLLTILPTHRVKKPSEPCLSPPYNPPEKYLLNA
ncbi:MAG TPA: hypothetical protein ACFYD6_08740 [Candidatus Brocadiia bacterium]|nr:hypothetical protein [Candidatus Brocadiales bacterium]